MHKSAKYHTAAALVLLMSSQALAQSSDKEALDDKVLMSEAQALTPNGQSPATWLKRLKFQRDVQNVTYALRKTYSDRLAGIYLDYDEVVPTMVIRMVGTRRSTDPTSALQTRYGQIVFSYGAPVTFKHLQEVFSAHQQLFRSLVSGVQGMFAGEQDSAIHVELYGNQQSDAQVRAIGDNVFGVQVAIRRLPGPVRLEAGGSGTLPSGCTGGFIVKNTATGVTGLSTAAHCGATNPTYLGLDGVTSQLTYQAAVYNASTDEEWFTTNTNNLPEFFIGPDAVEPVTAVITQANTMFASVVCHYGETTGYSCGQIESTAYQPTGANFSCNGSSCSSTYIEVYPAFSKPNVTSLACAGGDSGGPVAMGTEAAGIFLGGQSSGTARGQCANVFYLSTDYLSSLGLTVLLEQ